MHGFGINVSVECFSETKLFSSSKLKFTKDSRSLLFYFKIEICISENLNKALICIRIRNSSNTNEVFIALPFPAGAKS